MTELPEFGPVKKIAVPRVLITAGALTVAGLTIAGAAILPLPSYETRAIVAERQPAVAVDTKVCPGSALELGSNPTGNSLLYVPTGGVSVVTESQSARETLAGNRESGAGAPVKINAAVGEIVYASQSQSPETETVKGLATTQCSIPLREGWFVGASTSLGRSSVLLLSNPSDVISQVKIDIKSSDGRSQADEVVVDANSQQAISLASWIPGAESLALRFETQGGLVVAQIQTSTVRGLETGGVDYLLPMSAPSTDMVIPGIRVENLEDTLAIIEDESYSDLFPRLVLWNPGAEAVDAEIYIIPSDENAFANEFSQQVPAGAITVVELNALETGSYSVHLLSTDSLVAVASVGTKSEEAIDYAWFDAVTSFSGEDAIQVSTAPNALLTLINPGKASATFSIPELEFNTTLQPQEAITLPVESSKLLTINVTDGVISAGVTHASALGISSYPLIPKIVAANQVSLVSLY
ncbi:MAG: hypothetical protein KF916_05365 [Microbacteriaceae bacterium]|nr:hypothetical protein [Microbacteriaceae bacterium]